HDFLGNSQVFVFAFNFSDGSGGQQEVALTIRNNLPTIDANLTSLSTPEEATLLIDLRPLEFDLEDPGNLTWKLSSVNGGQLFNATLEGTLLTISPNTDRFGIGSIALELFDLDGGLASREISIEIQNTNDAPSFIGEVPDVSLFVGENFIFDANCSDSDNDTLQFFDNSTLFSIGPLDGIINFTPLVQNIGTYGVSITCNDGELTARDDFILTVVPVPPPSNTAPVLSFISDISVNEGETITIVAEATDAEGDILVFSINDSRFVKQGTDGSTFTYTTLFTDAGAIITNVSVSDGQLSDDQAVTILVGNVNRAPLLETIGNKQTNEGQLLRFTISGNDPDSDVLSFSAGNLPEGAAFNELSREFSWTPSPSQAGIFQVDFRVSDGALSDSEAVTITVGNVNQPPVITSTPVTTLREVFGSKLVSTYSYHVKAEDQDNEAVVFSLDKFPDGMKIDTWTGLITWKPTAEQVKSRHEVIVRATDPHGEFAVQQFTITIELPKKDSDPREKLFISRLRMDGQAYEVYQPGDSIFFDLTFENIGRYNTKKGTIRVTIPELGVSRKLGPFSGLEIGEGMGRGVLIEIPANAAEGTYTARISLSDVNGNRRSRHRDFRVVG
ncbi:hypothetical protein HYU13_00005, partial [Candidatus Woesearchaeota archaeon]|nr:hypothetical protein [Candidatus Woesearchaeota archaeon]